MGKNLNTASKLQNNRYNVLTTDMADGNIYCKKSITNNNNNNKNNNTNSNNVFLLSCNTLSIFTFVVSIVVCNVYITNKLLSFIICLYNCGYSYGEALVLSIVI